MTVVPVFLSKKISFVGRLTSESSSAKLAVSVFLPRRYRSACLGLSVRRRWRFTFPFQVDVVRAVSAAKVGVGVLVVGAAWHVFFSS